MMAILISSLPSGYPPTEEPFIWNPIVWFPFEKPFNVSKICNAAEKKSACWWKRKRE
jgi:hypothetical protein